MFYPIDDNGNDIRVGDEVKFIEAKKGSKFAKEIFQVVDIMSDNLVAVIDSKDKSYYFRSMNCKRVYEGSDAKISRRLSTKRIPPYTVDIPVGNPAFRRK